MDVCGRGDVCECFSDLRNGERMGEFKRVELDKCGKKELPKASRGSPFVQQAESGQGGLRLGAGCVRHRGGRCGLR